MGNSYGMILPSKMVEQLDLSYGDDVQVELNGTIIEISSIRNENLTEGVSADFFEQVEATFAVYDSTIKGLVDR